MANKKLTLLRTKYAVISALKELETYTFHSEIIIVSDHIPLKFLTECSSRSSRLQRWINVFMQRLHTRKRKTILMQIHYFTSVVNRLKLT